MFSHCVPFPAPGPPNTNITLYLAILYICLETHWMWCSVFVTHRKELLNENCRKPILKSYCRNLQLRQIKYITLMDFCTDHWSKVISNFKSYWILKIYNNSKQIGFFKYSGLKIYISIPFWCDFLKCLTFNLTAASSINNTLLFSEYWIPESFEHCLLNRKSEEVEAQF